ncbi:MAG: heme exporter protein CcmD [Sphingomicrobium sp.]
MNPWPFVVAAYAFALLATAGLLLASFASMRSAEAEAEKLRDRK